MDDKKIRKILKANKSDSIAYALPEKKQKPRSKEELLALLQKPEPADDLWVVVLTAKVFAVGLGVCVFLYALGVFDS